jgi:hypothetical protein
MTHVPNRFVLTRRALAVVATSAIFACADDPVEPTPNQPTPTDTSLAPNFVAAAAGAPVIANPVVSFYAKSGSDREAFMYYRPRPGGGGNDSTVFIRFRVRKDALLSRPDGSLFQVGDSVLITMTLVDPARLEVNFQPAGLRFSPTDPARLKFSFLEVNEDLNGDGKVNGDDLTVQGLLAIWQRESVSAPWIRLASVVSIGTHEIEANVGGFTSYIIAW